MRTPPKKQKPGPNTVLTAQEESRIKEWILYMSKVGFPLSATDILHAVIDYADKIRKTRNIPKSFPSRTWTQRFLNRHPEFKKKRTTRLSKAGAFLTEEQIRHWFLEIENTLLEEGINLPIFENPRRIFNFDESGFKLVPKEFLAICGQDAEDTCFVHNNCDRDSHTVLFGSNAAGELTPPKVLYPGKRMTRDIVNSTPEGWSVGISDEGWQTSKTFYEYK
ncbi:uncharacterized protein LOC129732248 [Wyeomyia smithii]|uniref:uncharacterized protein LOC129732248 n=1 Tax=Wyeomyia smithii TaxID=174621 RepID=UPI0024680DA2|nr:uncharacterized protein LOC129732248 [Wyeomyia smithii]